MAQLHRCKELVQKTPPLSLHAHFHTKTPKTLSLAAGHAYYTGFCRIDRAMGCL